MKGKRYSRKFQRMAVERMKACESVTELTGELGVRPRCLYKCRTRRTPCQWGLVFNVMMEIFLRLAARNPSVNRAVIVFAAWHEYCSCLRHDGQGSSPSKRAPRFG